MSLGTDLRLIREQKGLSLRQVEEISGISNSYLSQLENDKIKEPSPHILNALSKVFNVSYNYLMVQAGYIVYEKDAEVLPYIQPNILAGLNEQELQEAINFVRYLMFKRKK